jgi:hypothetical protein
MYVNKDLHVLFTFIEISVTNTGNDKIWRPMRRALDSDSLLHGVLDVPGDLLPAYDPGLDEEEDGAQEVQEGPDKRQAEGPKNRPQMDEMAGTTFLEVHTYVDVRNVERQNVEI